MRVTFLFPLLVLGLALAGGCSSSKKRKSTAPTANKSSFCTDWAKAACNSAVVSACAAADVDGCVAAQSEFCLAALPPHYDATNAKTCVAAVKAAYTDAKLTRDELTVVRDFGAPCDELNKGPGGEGESCATNDDCNTLEHLRCIKKIGDAIGNCQVPVEVGGGFPCTQLNETCVEGFYCNGANCLAAPTGGAACSDEIPCASDFQCTGAPGSQACTDKGDPTDPCAVDGECKSDICALNAAGGGICVDQVVLAATEPLCTDLR
jgi:hypothetical protein